MMASIHQNAGAVFLPGQVCQVCMSIHMRKHKNLLRKKGEINMDKQRIFLAIMNRACVRAAPDSVNSSRILPPLIPVILAAGKALRPAASRSTHAAIPSTSAAQCLPLPPCPGASDTPAPPVASSNGAGPCAQRPSHHPQMQGRTPAAPLLCARPAILHH
jgi:hypothetical protein